MRQTTLTQSGAPGDVIDGSDFAQWPTVVNIFGFVILGSPHIRYIGPGSITWQSGYCY